MAYYNTCDIDEDILVSGMMECDGCGCIVDVGTEIDNIDADDLVLCEYCKREDFGKDAQYYLNTDEVDEVGYMTDY